MSGADEEPLRLLLPLVEAALEVREISLSSARLNAPSNEFCARSSRDAGVNGRLGSFRLARASLSTWEIRAPRKPPRGRSGSRLADPEEFDPS